MNDEGTVTDDRDEDRESGPLPDAGPDAEAPPHRYAEEGGEAAAGRAGRGSARLYFVAFVLVLISFGALVLGGLALIGKGLSGSPTGYFWLSIVVSVVALALAVSAVFSTRRG